MTLRLRFGSKSQSELSQLRRSVMDSPVVIISAYSILKFIRRIRKACSANKDLSCTTAVGSFYGGTLWRIAQKRTRYPIFFSRQFCHWSYVMAILFAWLSFAKRGSFITLFVKVAFNCSNSRKLPLRKGYPKFYYLRLTFSLRMQRSRLI